MSRTPEVPSANASANAAGTLPPAAAGFAELGLAPALVLRAAALGWQRPTAVQRAVIPVAVQGRDVLALAPTGSGKTAAFLLPLLQRLQADAGLASERPRRLRALILSPTRELAMQTAEALHALAPELKAVVAIGGLSINPQMMALRGGANVVLATPGRLLDLVAHNALHLWAVDVLVLDEADRLLDLGFADEIGRVLALISKTRQTLMFAATLPDAVATLAGQVLHDPLRIEAAAADDAAAPDIVQRAIEVDAARRTPLLRHLIKTEGWDRVLVFVATQYATEHVADKLRQAGLSAAALHGQLSQGQRTQVLADFHGRALKVLVATDVASRGIDVAELAVVVNHDLPRSADDHTHRIGRTGRAGASGLAVSFICADVAGSVAHFRLIEKRRGQRVPRERVPGFEPSAAAALPADANASGNGGIKGRRKSKKDKLREAAARR